MTDLERFRGLELTSLISINETVQGAQPLVDVGELDHAPQPEIDGPVMPLADDTVGFHPQQIDFGQQQSAPSSSRHAAPLAAVQPLQTPAPRRAEQSQRRQSRSWPIWVLIFAAGVGTAAAVGLTGPRLRHSEAQAPAASTAPASTTPASTAPASAAPSTAPTSAPASAAPAANKDEPARGDEQADRVQ